MKSIREFSAVCAEKVAGSQQEAISKNSASISTATTPSSSQSAVLATQEDQHIKLSKIFPFISSTYQDLQKLNNGLNNDLISSQLIQTINKYKNGCNEIYAKVLESYDMCRKLAQNIVRTIDIFKELCTYLSDLEEYNYRLCEIISIFIVCELRLSVDAAQNEQLFIAQRIIYIMRRHLVQEEEHETLHNILRTLVYIPKLFNARDIMCAIFGEFIPLKPVPEANVYPDKLYILYIIVFYRWMMMQKDDDDKLLIVNFAETFMKPSVSLCSNNLYCPYLPMYTTHSSATRTILNNLKYRNVRHASLIDNAFKNIGSIVNLCDDEEDDIIIDSSPAPDFAQLFASVQLEPLSGSMSNVKLEEETIIGTVDLTEEESPTNAVSSISDRHDKWLNEFQKLAKQFRESQLLLQKQQNNPVISNNENSTVICLDSDSEEEEESSAAASKETATTVAATRQNNSEDLFVDNYPVTTTFLNCDSEVESLELEDENDVTKISPRYLSATLRTYKAKKFNFLETNHKINSGADKQNVSESMGKAYRRDSIHISSSPADEPENDDDEGTDVQDEHEADEEMETQAYTFLPTTSRRQERETFKEIRPMGPYPTYNNTRYDKVIFSQDTSRNAQQAEKKSPKKQKKRVQFNFNTQELKASSTAKKFPPESSIHETKKDYYLHGSKRSNDDTVSIFSSSSTSSSTKQKGATNIKCINQPTYNVKNYNHSKKFSNLYKNLSVFKQKCLNIKQKTVKNFKINLRKLRLDKDISLTNFENKFNNNKQEPHSTPLTLSKNNLNSPKNNTICTQTEPYQSKPNLITSPTEDDKIFKKPLPVTKNLFESPKTLKIEKVISLRSHPYYFKRRNTCKTEAEKKIPFIEEKKSLEHITYTHENNVEFDDLSKISKLLTDEINSLTSETSEKAIKETCDLQFNKKTEIEKIDKNIGDKDVQVVKNTSLTNIVELEGKVAEQSENLLILSNNLTPTKDIETNSNALDNIKPINNQSAVEETLQNLNDKTRSLSAKIINEREEENEKRDESPANEIKEKSMPNEVEMKNKIIQKYTKNINAPNDIADFDINSSTTQNSNSKAVKFSAEFLAGLPNELSLASAESEGEETVRNRENKIDFEFENNCSTPTMCPIDLDVMSENTSDVPATMPIKECEADKLLEDFNNKSEDILGSALNKIRCSGDTPKVSLSEKSSSEVSYHEEGFNKSSLIVDPREETEDEIIRKSMKKAERVPSSDKFGANFSSKDLDLNERVSRFLNDFESKLFDSGERNQADYTAFDCNQNKRSKALRDLRESAKSTKDNKLNFSKQEETKEIISPKNLKKTNKPSKDNVKKTVMPQIKNSADIEENRENNCENIEQSAKDGTLSNQMEASINENQHMAVELGKWKPELQDEIKNNDSEPVGVSAIFSFPKIPIISISIHTTPNKKAYFKISKRENDNQAKGNSKPKKIKYSQPDHEVESIYEEESVISNTLQSNTVISKENKMQLSSEEINEEDDDEMDGEEETEEQQEDEEADNSEIEKFSHDSNSACSLPLKKRPTQAEPNGEKTEESQSVITEQPQDIAAEVVIDNTCKDKTILADSTSLQLEQETKKYDKITETQEQKVVRDATPEIISADETLSLLNDFDDTRPSTSSSCFKKLPDLSSPFKRRVHTPIRPIGQTPIQVVAPQLKDNTPSPSHDHRTESQVPSISRMTTQSIQPLPESYPATPMLSVANVEKLMDFNRFIEDLLTCPDVMTIIDNANACGYYAEDQAYEMERIAILEHYNIANAKGNVSVTKPLYWKKSAGDTISIFNDNDNEWISLPPSTAKQLQKLSFVLSILQQQYKVNDVRQRINIALTFLIRNTSKFKNPSNSGLLQQPMSLYSRNALDLNSTNHNISQPLSSTSYFRVPTNNEVLNTNFSINQNIESVHELHSTNYSNNQQQPEMALQHESASNNNQNWNPAMHYVSSSATQVNEQANSVNSPQRFSSNNIECEQQQTQTPDKRGSCCDELNNDQIYINPPCASSPQNEVIVNTNGVELHEIPQDQQNIFISITDESGISNGNAESPLHKYNTRQQQQQFRILEDLEVSSSSSSLMQQPYAKRPCLGNSGTSLISNNFMRNNIIPTFGNQEINLQNPYRMQQQQMTNQNLNASPTLNFMQRNISQQNPSINIYNNTSLSSPLAQSQQKSQQRMCTRLASFSNNFSDIFQQNQTKSNESNYKDILQPYITYLIKDHEKTSKHLLQVFEEVSNSNLSNGSNNNTLTQHQQQFSSLLPPLIRNPQQNHMPGFHQITDSFGSVLPSLIRNPHQSTLVDRDSGALQVVQSFIEQSQPSFDTPQEQIMLTEQQQQQKTSSLNSPGFVKEYVIQKQKLRNFRKKEEEMQQLHKHFLQHRQDPQRLNSIKRKCQERNDKLAEDLKRKMVEFSMLKHNVQVKLLEKNQKQEQKQQQIEISQMGATSMTTKRRGRPRKIVNKFPMKNNAEAKTSNKHFIVNDKYRNKFTTRVTRRNQNNTVTTTVDHAYFRQRSAAREAAKRINATVNNGFH